MYLRFSVISENLYIFFNIFLLFFNIILNLTIFYIVHTKLNFEKLKKTKDRLLYFKRKREESK